MIGWILAAVFFVAWWRAQSALFRAKETIETLQARARLNMACTQERLRSREVLKQIAEMTVGEPGELATAVNKAASEQLI